MSAARPVSAAGGIAESAHQALLLLERWRKSLVRALDRVLVREELSLAEWLIVCELAAGAAPLSHIARRLSRDPGSLSRAITQLIRRGLLGSVRHGCDRRRATLSLTAQGRSLHGRVSGAIGTRAWLQSVQEKLPVERLWALLDAAPGRLLPAQPGHHVPAQENDR